MAWEGRRRMAPAREVEGNCERIHVHTAYKLPKPGSEAESDHGEIQLLLSPPSKVAH